MKKYFTDETTKNKSFLNFVKRYKDDTYVNTSYGKTSNNIDVSECLKLYDKDLIWVNPYKDSLTDEMKRKILNECVINPWYYLREIARDMEGNYFEMDMAKFAVTWNFLRGVNCFYNAPAITKRDEYASALMQVSKISTGGSVNIFMSTPKEYRYVEAYKDYMELENSLDIFESISSSNVVKYVESDYKNLSTHLLRDTNTIYTAGISMYSDDATKLQTILDIIVPVMKIHSSSSRDRFTLSNTGYMPGAFIIVGDPTNIGATKEIFTNCQTSGSVFSIGNGRLAKGNVDMELTADKMSRLNSFMLIDYDLIECDVNIPQEFRKFYHSLINIDSAPSIDVIKTFTSKFLCKRYDELDIVDKISINKMYFELLKECR